MFCTIWYNLRNLKYVKKHPWVFFTLIKLYKWYKIAKSVPNQTLLWIVSSQNLKLEKIFFIQLFGCSKVTFGLLPR